MRLVRRLMVTNKAIQLKSFAQKHEMMAVEFITVESLMINAFTDT